VIVVLSCLATNQIRNKVLKNSGERRTIEKERNERKEREEWKERKSGKSGKSIKRIKRDKEG
jgi:hypothetical protein